MRLKRKIVNIDPEKCTGCGDCVSACAEGAIELVNGKAQLVAELYCDGLAACLGECPQGAISMVEREADAFDPEAVEEHLAGQPTARKEAARQGITEEVSVPCGCPSAQMQMFSSCEGPQKVSAGARAASALTHWPVQIRLVPASAPFLKNADLLVASDCTPMAYPNFHEDFLKNRVVMMGCPKFDDVDEYVNKFAEIFQKNHINSITIVIMEVPCCSKMPMIVQKGMELAGKAVPAQIITINSRGSIIRRTALAA